MAYDFWWVLRLLSSSSCNQAKIRSSKAFPLPLCHPLSHHYAVAGMWDSTFRHVEKRVRNLIAAWVKIHDFHAEGASGQYEISLAPLPPMEAADEIVRAHDIIKTTVAAEGYIATMIPRPRLARQSNGEHIHISLQSNDNQRTEESFLAGCLRWISAICAVTLTYILNHTAA